MHRTADSKIILAADIGGTYARFALFTVDIGASSPENSLKLLRKLRFPIAHCDSSTALMRLLAEKPADDGGYFTPLSPLPVQPDAAVFAIPGPTAIADPSKTPPADEICRCQNIPWPFEAKALSQGLGGIPVRLINDFVANGFACALLPEQELHARLVLPGSMRKDFSQAVIGAGTGLGHCLILPSSPPMVLGCEAGHAPFPFLPDEGALAKKLAALRGGGLLEMEHLASGGGLALLYTCCTGKELPPFEAPQAVAEHEESFALAARFYGRAVCCYTLNTLALGGIYICGGVADNLPGILSHPEFVAELRERSPMSHVLSPIPLQHIQNRTLGLWGAASCAVMSLMKSAFKSS